MTDSDQSARIARLEAALREIEASPQNLMASGQVGEVWHEDALLALKCAADIASRALNDKGDTE